MSNFWGAVHFVCFGGAKQQNPAKMLRRCKVLQRQSTAKTNYDKDSTANRCNNFISCQVYILPEKCVSVKSFALL